MKKRILISIAAGLLVPLAYPPFHLWWATALAPAFLLLSLLKAKGLREAFLLGFLFGVFGIGLHSFWITSFAREAGTWSLIFFILTVLFHATLTACFSAVFHGFKKSLSPASALLLSPLLWTIVEFLGTYGAFGVPEVIGHSQFLTPVLREAAPVLGVNYVGFLTVSLGALVLLRRVVPAAVLLGLLTLNPIVNASFRALRSSEPVRPVSLVLIQPTLPQEWINDTAKTEAIYEAHLQETERHFANSDLLIWPENVLPEAGNVSSRWRYRLQNTMHDYPGQLLLGAPAREGPLLHNAAFIFERGEPIGHYEKERLFPFGEVIKYPFFFSWAQTFLPFKLARNTYDAGFKTGPLNAKVGSLGLSICFESLFTDLSRRRVGQGAEILINLTNDSWFKNSTASEKHFFVGAMRALENGRYFVQSSLYGVTGVVDPEGRVVARTGPEGNQTLSMTVYPFQGKTWYTRIGAWRFAVFSLITALFLFIESCPTSFRFRSRR